MKEFQYTITDPLGIHARPAGELVRAAGAFPCRITIVKDEREVDAKRIMGVMSLGIKCGTTVTVKMDGEKEEEAFAALKHFFETTL